MANQNIWREWAPARGSEIEPAKKFKEIGGCSSLCVGWLRQVLYNILGLIKSSAQLRQAEQEAADCRAEAAARKERRRFAEALTLFYMLKLMERNKCCHHSFSPLCVRYMQTRTNVRARTLPLALPNVTFFSLSLSVSSSAIGGLCHIWVFMFLNVLSVVGRESDSLRVFFCKFVGGDLGKKQQRIPLYPRQPGESSQLETAQHNSVENP